MMRPRASGLFLFLKGGLISKRKGNSALRDGNVIL